jgi:predicted phosphoribosyltransferase/dienelactone hydrolase
MMDSPGRPTRSFVRQVSIPSGAVRLEGELVVPAGAEGIVLFAHGSGSSRWSARNRRVAAALHEARVATLLFDLLTAEEEAEDRQTARWRFDIPFLSERLMAATVWASQQRAIEGLPIGYFGASTGAAAALVAAARFGEAIRAVVSRGGRPDLAGAALPRVLAPTLLIVGSRDEQVLSLNRAALAVLRCPKQLILVPGATHLFEEPGTLEEVSRLAAQWFRSQFVPARGSRRAAASGNGHAREPFEIPFRDRREAGRALARWLGGYAGRADVLVLALPRGGVPVAWEVARALRAPLDVFLVRKLGMPGQPELAMGAIASGGVRVLDTDLVERFGIPRDRIDAVTREEERELRRRERSYRGDRAPLDLRGRAVLLVDDGLATGSSMRAAIAAVRRLGPKEIVVAVPVAPAATCRDLAGLADDVVCVASPDPFLAVGRFYENFEQTTDEEVRDLLESASDSRLVPSSGGRR